MDVFTLCKTHNLRQRFLFHSPCLAVTGVKPRVSNQCQMAYCSLLDISNARQCKMTSDLLMIATMRQLYCVRVTSINFLTINWHLPIHLNVSDFSFVISRFNEDCWQSSSTGSGSMAAFQSLDKETSKDLAAMRCSLSNNLDKFCQTDDRRYASIFL